MKLGNVKFTTMATYSNGEMAVRYFCTEEAMSKYANKQYRKDEGVTVEVYEGAGIDGKRYCTYHA